MVADHGGFAYHNAGAVVDEEVGADGGAGVDVNTGTAVSVFGHHAGDDGHMAQIQLACHAIGEDGEQARIGENDLLLVPRRRVAVENSLHICQQHRLNGGQTLDDLSGQHLGAGGFLLRQGQRDLRGKLFFNALYQQGSIVFRL